MLLAVDAALDRHDLAPAARDGLLGNLARHRKGRGAFFVRVLKAAEVLEALLPHEVLEQVEIRLGFSGQTDDERRAQGEAGNPPPQLGQQLDKEPRVPTSPHRQEQLVRRVLHWHVDILCDLRLVGDGVDQLVGKYPRVGVVEADPAHLQVAERAK